jgi:hypothetical protein
VDVLSLQKALDKLNDETLPKVEKLVNDDLTKLVTEVHALLDRIDGTKINVTIDVPPRGVGPSNG